MVLLVDIGCGVGGEARKGVPFYNILIFILQTTSNIMCHDINEMQIPSYLLALPQHHKPF